MKRLLMFLSLAIVGSAQAQTYPLDKAPKGIGETGLGIDMPDRSASRWSEAIAARRIEPSMPITLAIGLLGRQPDRKTKIGVACGMLEVLTWHREQMRIVTRGGFVSTVVTSD